MSPSQIVAAVVPSWLWAPPGATWLDVLFAYGTIVLLIGLIAWNRMESSPEASVDSGEAPGADDAVSAEPAAGVVAGVASRS